MLAAFQMLSNPSFLAALHTVINHTDIKSFLACKLVHLLILYPIILFAFNIYHSHLFSADLMFLARLQVAIN